MVAPTKILPVAKSNLFTWGTKLRMGAEVLRSPRLMPDRSVSDFVRDHFGGEAVDYLAEPLLAGVYGGSPDELSAPAVLPKFVEYEQRFGSVVVGAIRNKAKTNGHAPIFQTLKSGMGTLIRTLTEQVALIRARVGSLAPAEEGWQLYADGAWHNFDCVVLACG